MSRRARRASASTTRRCGAAWSASGPTSSPPTAPPASSDGGGARPRRCLASRPESGEPADIAGHSHTPTFGGTPIDAAEKDADHRFRWTGERDVGRGGTVGKQLRPPIRGDEGDGRFVV